MEIITGYQHSHMHGHCQLSHVAPCRRACMGMPIPRRWLAAAGLEMHARAYMRTKPRRACGVSQAFRVVAIPAPAECRPVAVGIQIRRGHAHPGWQAVVLAGFGLAQCPKLRPIAICTTMPLASASWPWRCMSIASACIS